MFVKTISSLSLWFFYFGIVLAVVKLLALLETNCPSCYWLFFGSFIFSCLCWMDIFPLGFCWPLWFLGDYGSYILPGMKFIWNSEICGIRGFQENLFIDTGHWRLLIWWSLECWGDVSRVWYQDLFIILEWGPRVRRGLNRSSPRELGWDWRIGLGGM